MAALTGSYVAVLNSTLIGVALPLMAEDLGPGRHLGLQIDWVVSGYLVGIVVAQPLTGWFVDVWGRRVTLRASLLVSAGGAAVCATAPGLEVLLVGRVVQGLGAGAVIPITMTTVYGLFPAGHRGVALGIWGVANMAGPAVGPPLGGWLVSLMSWRAVFVVFVLLAGIASLLVHAFVPGGEAARPRPFDVLSWSLAVCAFVTLVVAARNLPSWGLSTASVLAVTAASAALALLVWRSLRLATPLIRFQLFTVPAFSASLIVLCLLSSVQIAKYTFIPLQLQVVRDLDARQVGLLLTPSAIGSAASMPLGGWLTDRIGARAPALVGLGLGAVGLWLLSDLQVDDDLGRIAVALVVQGFGAGLVSIPLALSALNSLPARFHAYSSATTALARQLSGAIAVAVFASMLVTALGSVAPAGVPDAVAQDAYNRIFFYCFVAMCGSAAVAWALLPRGAARRSGRRRMRDGEELAQISQDHVVD